MYLFLGCNYNFPNVKSDVNFITQTMPVAMALLRDVHNLCPKEVLMFILDLIKYNDNRKNKVKTVFILISYFLFCWKEF